MARQIMDLLDKINGNGTTIVMVSHDPEMARRAHRQIHILDGRVLELSESEAPPLLTPALETV